MPSFLLSIVALSIITWGPQAEGQVFPNQLITRLKMGRITGVAFSPDNKLIGVSSSIGIWLYDGLTLEPLELLTANGELVKTNGVEFSSDGSLIVGSKGGEDQGTIYVWDVATRRLIKGLRVGYQGSIVFDPTGEVLAIDTGGARGAIGLWNVKSGELLGVPIGHQPTFSPDGLTLASTSGNTVRLWDMAQQREGRILEGHQADVTSVSFHPSGVMLAAGGADSTLRLWDVNEGKQIGMVEAGPVSCVVFSPDGRLLASSGGDGIMRLWEVEGLKQVGTVETGSVSCVVFSPDGRLLASSGGDSIVRLWETEGLKPTDIFQATRPAGNVTFRLFLAFSPDGQRLSAYFDDFYSNTPTIQFWSVLQRRIVGVIRDRHLPSSLGDLSPDGRMLAVYDQTRSPKIEIWEMGHNRLLATLEGHTDQILSAAFSADGHRLISGGRDGTIRVWELAQGTERSRLSYDLPRDFRAEKIALSPDGGLAAVLTRPYPMVDPSSYNYPPPQADLYDLATDQLLFRRQEPADYATAPVFSPDSRLMVMPGGAGSVLIDVANQKEVGQLKDALAPYAFNPDGTLVAAVQKGPAGQIRMVSLWHTDPVGMVGTLKTHGSMVGHLAFSPDGALLASFGYHGSTASGGGDDNTTIWDLASLEEVGRFEAPTMGGAFSPDGRLLAIQGIGTVYLWDVAQRVPLRQLRGHAGPVNRMRFSGDGRWLVTGGGDIELWYDEDGTVLIWEVTPATTVAEGEGARPATFSLDPNYPNPFNPTTTLRFSLPQPGEAELSVYNLLGQRVAILVQGMQEAGAHTILWNGRDDTGHELATGVYFYRLQAGARVESRKLLLLR